MEGVGFAKSQDSLPLLFKEVYGYDLPRNCGGCLQDAYNTLVRWANKNSKKETSSMGYKIKKEFEKTDFPVTQNGAMIFINSQNLNDERALILLSIPKYAHAIEGQPDLPVVEFKPLSPNELEASTASTSESQKSGGSRLKAKGGKLVKS